MLTIPDRRLGSYRPPCSLDIAEAFLPWRPPSHSPPQDRAKRESRERQSKTTQGETALTMGPLPNVRHEKFVQALFAGKNATEAYTLAGYKPHQGNSSRLRWFEMVQSRLQELQGEAAANAEVTLQSILKELDQAIAVAKSKSQAQAMVSASGLKAKLSGLLTEKIEIGAPGAFDGAASTAQIVDGVLERLVIERFLPCDAEDRRGLIELYEKHLQEIDAYISAIQSRPILMEKVDVRRLDRPWQQLETHSAPARLRSNGSAR